MRVPKRRWLVVSATGIDEARLGMTLEQAQAAVANIGALQPYPGADPRWFTSGDVFLSVGFNAEGRVESLELSDPWRDRSTGSRLGVTFDGIPLFEEPADTVALILRDRFGGHFEENGYAFTVPSVLLALWRDANGRNEPYEDDPPRHWSTVLVARPGYYDR